MRRAGRVAQGPPAGSRAASAVVGTHPVKESGEGARDPGLSRRESLEALCPAFLRC